MRFAFVRPNFLWFREGKMAKNVENLKNSIFIRRNVRLRWPVSKTHLNGRLPVGVSILPIQDGHCTQALNFNPRCTHRERRFMMRLSSVHWLLAQKQNAHRTRAAACWPLVSSRTQMWFNGLPIAQSRSKCFKCRWSIAFLTTWLESWRTIAAEWYIWQSTICCHHLFAK